MEALTKFKIPAEEIPKLRSNERFLKILQLCRIANQLVFCSSTLDARPNDNSPRDVLITVNHLLFSAGILFESLKLAQVLGKDFNNFPSYKRGFAKLLKDKNTKKLKEDFLPKVRNGLVYHIDPEPLEDTLQWLTLPEYVFAATTDGKKINTHFQLADDLAMHSIIGDTGDDEELERQLFTELFESFATFTTGYIQASIDLIFEYAERKGWGLEGTVRPRVGLRGGAKKRHAKSGRKKKR